MENRKVINRKKYIRFMFVAALTLIYLVVESLKED